MANKKLNVNTNKDVLYKKGLWALGWFLVIWGIILRSLYFLSNPPILSDVIRTYYVLKDISFLDVFKLGSSIHTFLHDPQGILIIEKALFTLWGNSEYILRLCTFLCGCLSVVIFRKIKDQFVGTYAGIVALALFSSSFWLILFSVDENCYSSDLVVTMLLYMLFLHMSHCKINHKKILAFSMAAGLSCWFSLPAIFILGGGFLSLFIVTIFDKQNRQRLWAYGIVFSVSFISFAYYYVTALINFRTGGLAHVFLPHFMPIHGSLTYVIVWLKEHFYFMFLNPLSLSPFLGIFFWVIGMVKLLKDNKMKGLILLLPFILMLGASAMRGYPYWQRTVIFLAPAFYLIIARGWEYLFLKEKEKYMPLISIFLLLFLFYNPLRPSLPFFFLKHKPHPMLSIQNKIKLNFRKGDIIYVGDQVKWEFLYYVERTGLEEDKYYIQKKAGDFIFDTNKTKYKRIWYISRASSEEQILKILYKLNRIGACVSAEGKEYVTYLYMAQEPDRHK